MKKKLFKYMKFLVSMALILSLVAPSYASLSASDGSAFVTKAEFDSALADFNSRLTVFEAGINSKIDSQVTSYLDRNGIWSGKEQKLENGFDDAYIYWWYLHSTANLDTTKFKYMLWYPSEVNAAAIPWAKAATHAAEMANYGFSGQNASSDGALTKAYGAYQYNYYQLQAGDEDYFNQIWTGKIPKAQVIKKIDKSGLLVMTAQYVWECWNGDGEKSDVNKSGIANWASLDRADRDKINVSEISYINSDSAFWDIFMTTQTAGQVSTVSSLSEMYYIYSSKEESPDITDDSKFTLQYSNTVGTTDMFISNRTKKSTGLHPRGINQIMIFVQKGESIWFDAQITKQGRFADGLCVFVVNQGTLDPYKGTVQCAYRFADTKVY